MQRSTLITIQRTMGSNLVYRQPIQIRLYPQISLNTMVSQYPFTHSQAMYIRYQKLDNKFISNSTGPNSKLNPVVEYGGILDWDDKFGLNQIVDPQVILKHLSDVNYSYDVDDLKYFLMKLVDIKYLYNKQVDGTPQFSQLIAAVKMQLKTESHQNKQARIGSLSYCMRKLDVKDSELWQIFQQRINSDQWYTNFTESVYACEGFVKLGLLAPQKRIDSVYQKIERIISISMWEVNMTYYKRIAEGLVEANRRGDQIFYQIQQRVLSNLDMGYEQSTMVDLLFAFSKAGQGTKQFYDTIQYILFKGHMFDRPILMPLRMELPFDGKMISKVFEIYSDMGQKFPQLQLHAEFKSMMYKYAINRKVKYDLNQWVNLMNALPYYQYEEINIIESELVKQLAEYDGHVNYRQLIKCYTFLLEKFEGKVEKMPPIILTQLQYLFLNGVNQEDPNQFVWLLEFMINNNLLVQFKNLPLYLDKIATEKLLLLSKENIQILANITKESKLLAQNHPNLIDDSSIFNNMPLLQSNDRILEETENQNSGNNKLNQVDDYMVALKYASLLSEKSKSKALQSQ